MLPGRVINQARLLRSPHFIAHRTFFGSKQPAGRLRPRESDSGRLLNLLVGGGVGVFSGVYIFKPLIEAHWEEKLEEERIAKEAKK